MTTIIRRTVVAVAAVAVTLGASAGVASAAVPTAAHTGSVRFNTGFEPSCFFDHNFNWFHYNFCNDRHWHGSHQHDYDNWRRRHHDWDRNDRRDHHDRGWDRNNHR